MANDPPKKYVMLPGQSHFLDSESLLILNVAHLMEVT